MSLRADFGGGLSLLGVCRRLGRCLWERPGSLSGRLRSSVPATHASKCCACHPWSHRLSKCCAGWGASPPKRGGFLYIDTVEGGPLIFLQIGRRQKASAEDALGGWPLHRPVRLSQCHHHGLRLHQRRGCHATRRFIWTPHDF